MKTGRLNPLMLWSVFVVTFIVVATPGFAQELDVTKLQMKLDFKKTNATANVTSLINITDKTYSFANRTAVVEIADAAVSFPLDSKGRGVNGKSLFKPSYNKKQGAWGFTAKLVGGASMVTAWGTNGLVNETITRPGDRVDLPVTLTVDGGTPYEVTTNAHYTATAGKSGTIGSINCAKCHH